MSDEDTASAPAPSQARLFEARDLTMGGLFGALALVVPIAFHPIGGAGKMFLPMFLPILALGLLASWEVCLIVGCIVPLLSSSLTGMPPPPTAILMMFELTAMAAVASLCRSRGWGIWPAAIAAIVAAKVVGAIEVLTIAPMVGYTEDLLAYVLASFGVSLPGTILLLTVVPGAVGLIEKVSILGRPAKGA